MRLEMRFGLRWEPAVVRKPSAVFCTEGARAGKCVGGALAGAVCPQAAAMRLGLRFGLRWESVVGRKPPAVFCTEGARAGRCVGGALAGSFARRLPPCGWDCVLDCVGNQRLCGSPRLYFAPKVRALAGALVGRWRGLLPAGCRHAATMRRSAVGDAAWVRPRVPVESCSGTLQVPRRDRGHRCRRCDVEGKLR